jgi:peptide/nickel transport system substrate-binding protein
MVRSLACSLVAMAIAVAPIGTLAETPSDMLVIGSTLPRNMDPADNNAKVASELIANAYDTLVQTTPDDIATAKPMLATEWTLSDDGRTITFALRDDVTFQSGNPLTARDAAWSLHRVIKVGGTGSTDFAQWGFTEANVESLIRAVDDYSLEVELPEDVDVNLVLLSLAGASLGIIDSQTAMSHEANNDMGGAWLGANTAGSGPFFSVQWRPNELAMFEGRDDYWGGAPAMKRVAYRAISESGSLRLQVEAGDIDVAQGMAAGDLEALSSNPEVVIDPVPALGFYYIALNTLDPDLAKPLVREAFSHAFNWEGAANSHMKYFGTPWQSVIPKGMMGAPEDAVDRYTYDPERACQLLEEAGYPDGIKKVLNTANPNIHLANAEVLQASAASACIELNLIPGEFTDAFRERSFEVITGNSGSRLPDPLGVLTQYAYNPDNSDQARLSSLYQWRVGQQSDELNSLVEEARKNMPAEERTELIAKIEALYQELNPGLVIYFQRSDPYVIRANVKGYAGHTTWATRWHGVTKD